MHQKNIRIATLAFSTALYFNDVYSYCCNRIITLSIIHFSGFSIENIPTREILGTVRESVYKIEPKIVRITHNA